MNKEISIIVPVYNAGSYLDDSIKSVLNQSFDNFELILINDGSIDESLAICTKYAGIDKRIKIIDQKNKGVSVARNEGIKIANGKWIVFVDADDYLLPNALSALLDCAIQMNADMVLGKSMKLKNGLLSEAYSFEKEVSTEVSLDLKHFALWGYLFRADYIKNKLTFIDGLAYSEDRVFLYQLSAKSQKLAYCNSGVYVYRINESSACNSSNRVRNAEHQFWAASHLNKLAQVNKQNKKFYTKLERERKFINNMGLYKFVELPFNETEYKAVKDFYFKHNNTISFYKARFYYGFIINYIIAKRRKLIRPRDLLK